jgi:glycosyltransferase involved in cell wall biosynthesis
MRVLHAYNAHRQGGGSDDACRETIRASRQAGLEVGIFARDSNALPAGWRGKAQAFASGLYAAAAIAEFRRRLAEFRPQVVHTHELYPLISPWILPQCRAAGVPVVHTCYDFRLTCPVATHFQNGKTCRRCLGGREYWAVLNNCRGHFGESLAYALRNALARKFALFTKHVDHFIVQTEFGRDWLSRELGVGTERITVNPCAIAAPASSADPAQGAYIGFAGRFVPEKGVEYLIDAARRTGLPVRLAGNASSHPAIRPGDPVECVSTPSREDLDCFYRNARMLVVPSIWYETFGLVAAEAMSHGIPVVASRIGALLETVQDGITGLLFEPRNTDELARCVLRLWHDPHLCRELGAAGRRRIVGECNTTRHVTRLLDAYRGAIGSARGGLATALAQSGSVRVGELVGNQAVTTDHSRALNPPAP